ncbi:MAG: ABC transporter permease subunit, partial [Polyangiaceae bacterium]
MSGTEASRLRARSRTRTWLGLLAGLVLTVASWLETGADPRLLFDARGARQAADILGGLLRPDLGGAFLWHTGRLLLESIAIGVAGVSLALLLGIPAALGAARSPQLVDPPGTPTLGHRCRTVTRWVMRGLLSLFRSVPDIVWAFIFVRLVGLGPLAAVLAIAISFAGILGKLYAEHIEACDPQTVRNLRATGHGSVSVFAYSIWPQVRQDWISYGLIRFECAIRSAAVLGVVGAGGIGAEIELSIRYFEYEKLGTAILALLGCMVLMEFGSVWLRTRASRRSWSALAMLGIVAIVGLDLPWSELRGIGQQAQILKKMSSANTFAFDGTVVLHALDLMMETLAMAWIATVAAAAVASLLAPLAVRSLTVRGYLNDPPRASRPRAWLSLLGLRGLLQCLRAVPELVWALAFVVWVGPGPVAGILALGLHTLGLLGRLFAEVYEEAGSGGLRQLEASGAS